MHGFEATRADITLDELAARYAEEDAARLLAALDEAAAEGRVKPGQYVLLSGFGAGLAWGTAVLRW